ncbi:MAG: TM2 domain-containing protein [Flavobacterium sp.]|uniref:TM2 domain-containing protein n=1 Tax=Flavobacterium sp. TaxID=239 RepID=UPI0022C08CDA|nr:TM2 domain-containing protein [Flavobacterium sp.]MCZ8196895.1 TM2 domain-containing protein [Flavobacterium sp.]
MKIKLFFSLIAFFMLSLSASYASFPVEQRTTTNTTTVVEQKEELSSPAAAKGEKSQIIALVLAALVGGIGIHRFYLGYTWQGIVQLLTLGGCGVWALIDLIRIITGDLKPKDGNYDKTL